MKKISLLLIMFITVFVTSCKTDKEIVKVKNTFTANVLSPLTPTTFVLSMDNAAGNFQKFKWTGADFGFSASVSYLVQFDKKTDNFKSPIDLITVTGVDTAVVKVGDINKLMLSNSMNPDEAVALQFRVRAMIDPTVDTIFSNVQEATVTPYATSFPPIYMCGGAVGGWGWDLYEYKELRSSAPNVYSTIGYFTNDIFRFFKQVGWSGTSWNYPYFTGTVSPLFVLNTGDSDNNFKFVGTPGYYQVTVNMSTKSVSMTAVDEPVLYATGAALGGWDWTTNYIQLTWKSNGIFQATTDFVVETFRFFAVLGWGTSYNYPWFDGGSVTPLLINANDGDKNFKFVGTPGVYTITVNLIDKIVTMTP